ncbi:MAG: SpoIVB peptidase [Oscillospiraceae bacterium]|nr:SpoIVB peptidase [Oscillospiraceae bacterium]
MGKFFKFLAIILLLAVTAGGAVIGIEYKELPDTLYVTEGTSLGLERTLPVVITDGSGAMAAAAHANNNSERNYDSMYKLAGIVPIKPVNVQIVKERKVIPCGTPFGIKIFTDGVMIVGTAPVPTKSGARNPATEAGLQEGDVIEAVNGINVYKTEVVADIIEQSTGEPIEVSVRREKEHKEFTFRAVQSEDGSYKAGMWIRDSSAGIGTMTYIDPETGAFGGLGHGICDVDTGKLVPISQGEIVGVALTGVSKSASGAPGELKGYLDTETIGRLCLNNEMGVYGLITAQDDKRYSQKQYTVAMKQEVREGKAQIIATIPGEEPAYYDIVIDKVNYDEKSKSKNLVVKVTDSKLLKATGGIVQGMSGSPIIQNGKFIGAVTHVFVNNPALGYGIFAENMLKNNNNIQNQAINTAS